MLRTLGVAVGIVAVSFATSCAVKARNRQIHSAIQRSDISVNPNQIQLRMRSLVDPFAGEIEQSADSIIANASTTSVKRAAIRWKIEGVPELRGALCTEAGFRDCTVQGLGDVPFKGTWLGISGRIEAF